MSGRAHGSDYKLHVFQKGELVKVIQPNDMTVRANNQSDRIKRQGTTESTPDVRRDGWEVEGTFDVESFALDDAFDQQSQTYYDGQPVDRMEILQTKHVPKTGGTRTYRYTSAAISDYEESHGGQNEPGEISVTFMTGKRKQV